ncbi:MAG: metal ABC transporter permease [Thermoplasmata archaeon]
MTILDALLFGFMQRALVAGVLVAVAAAVMGTFIILRGMSLLGDSLAHASFGGVALGIFFSVSPFYFALLSAVVGGVIIHILEHRGIVRGDAALGIVLSGGLGLGIIIASAAGGFNINLLSFLFGSILTVTWQDVLLFAILVAVLMVVVVGLYKEYLYLTFDEETAEASGLPAHGLNILFAVLTAVAVVASIKIVGVLLVSALLVVPSAASQHIARSFRQSLGLAVVFALVSTVGGVFLAFLFDWPPGGAIAVVSLSLFAAVVLSERSYHWIMAAPEG